MINHLRDPVDATQWFGDVLPRGEEAAECSCIDRLDLLSERRKRPAAQPSQHFGIAPLAADSPGPELALHDPLLPPQLAERSEGHSGSDTESGGDIRHREWPVRACVAADEIAERVVDRLDEHRRDTDGKGDAERVTQPGRVFDDRPPVGSGTPNPGAALEVREPGADISSCLIRRLNARLNFVDRQRAEDTQQVDDPLGTFHATVGCEALQLELGLLDHSGIEQFAQFGPTEQLGE